MDSEGLHCSEDGDERAPKCREARGPSNVHPADRVSYFTEELEPREELLDRKWRPSTVK